MGRNVFFRQVTMRKLSTTPLPIGNLVLDIGPNLRYSVSRRVGSGALDVLRRGSSGVHDQQKSRGFRPGFLSSPGHLDTMTGRLPALYPAERNKTAFILLRSSGLFI